MNIKRILAVLSAAVMTFCISAGTVQAEQTLQTSQTSQHENTEPYVVTVYNDRNGLPTGEANDIIQTSNGYIWIGSYGGLIRYNGSDFKNFSINGELSFPAVRSLFEDSSGRLWIGTNDSGVFFMQDGVITAIDSPDGNSFLCVRDFDEGADGTIYVASNSGMAEIKDGKLIPYDGEYISGETVYSVSTDSLGRVWGALNSGLCAVAEDGVLKRVFSSEQFFDGEDIYCTASDSSGNIYLGSSGSSAVKISFSSESLEPEDMNIEPFVTNDVNTHNSIKPAADGRMIVCGSVGSCIIDADGNQTSFSSSDKAAAVNSGYIDYEGNIWLASTSYGVIKYTKGYFSSPNAEAGLEDIPLNAVAVQNGYCYAATDNGLLIFDSESWQPISNELTELYDGARVRSLLADSKGNLWVAAYAYTDSVACYNSADGSLKTFNTEDGLISTSARTLLELSDGSIAAGTQEGLNIIRDGEIVKSFGSNEGLEVSSILCLLESENGTLLAGSDGGGIYEISGDTVKNYSFDEGLSDGVVLRMLKDPDNGGFFISAGSSLYYWNDSGFRKLSDIKKSAGSIFDLYDRNGMLWILQNNGILAFDKEKILAGEEVLPKEYSLEHGLSGTLNANTWNFTDSDGSLYISTRNGISVFRFGLVENILPKGAINEVNVDGEIFSSTQELSLKKDANRVTIDFSALSYTDTTNIGISYFLEGFDKEETVITGEKSGSISYTNLHGGDYVFHLKIFDPENPGHFNSYELPVTKEMKIYEYPFFILAATLLLIILSVGIVVLISQAKIRSIQKRQREYRSIIEQSLLTFASAIDAKDPYTNGHSFRVAQYSRELARRMGKTELEQENIYYIALLHDIGKIGIPDSILNKPDKLTDEEREIIKRHPLIGGDILKNFTALEGISEGAKYHHERYDGNGYCEQIAGTDIPQVARIIGVADTYDAMSSDRCYVKAMPSEVIIKELNDFSGTQFDPEVVPYMLGMIEDGYAPIKLDPSENE